MQKRPKLLGVIGYSLMADADWLETLKCFNWILPAFNFFPMSNDNHELSLVFKRYFLVCDWAVVPG